jgi:AcrR family transcriptional regulator
VARTREKLEETLLALLCEEGYERTSVRALVRRAEVGKSTFYEHFDDKDAVLESRLARLGRALRTASVETNLRFAFVEPLLEHVNAHQKLGARLRRSSAGALVLSRFKQVVRTFVAEELFRLYPNAAPARLELATEHVTGSLASLLEASSERVHRGERDALAASFRRLVMPGLDAWFAPSSTAS